MKRKINLHHTIKNVATLMELKAGEQEITFNYNLAPEPIYINADEQQMEQALINIVKNAIESINDNGSIHFTTTPHPRKLIITDTGPGISPQHAKQLFSPFFSTKKDGQGVGLTLVKEILLNHNAEFSLETVQQGETNFTIMFE